jgi:hypothetical protein
MFWRVLILLCAFFGFYLATVQPMAWWLSRGWVLTPAVVTLSEMEYFQGNRSNAQTSRVQLRYDYEYGGRRYSGHRALLHDGSSSLGDEVKWSQIRGQGQVIQVHVNPQRPEQSLASRQFNWAALLMALAFAAVWLLALNLLLRRRGRGTVVQPTLDVVWSAHEPGRVKSEFAPLWLREVLTLVVLAIGVSYWSVSRGFEPLPRAGLTAQATPKTPDARAQAMLARLPVQPVTFDIGPSQWAYMAITSGQLRIQDGQLRLTHAALRIVQNAPCPSEACQPIRSVQWMLAAPSNPNQPQAGWSHAARSPVQLIELVPQRVGDEFVLPAGEVVLRIERDFEPSQAYLTVQLTMQPDRTTYSASGLLWPR